MMINIQSLKTLHTLAASGGVFVPCYIRILGSGSTLVACDEVGRRCFGVEIDPLYVDVAVRRWQRATHRDAIFEDGGTIRRAGHTARCRGRPAYQSQ
jgi:hypothetical protein